MSDQRNDGATSADFDLGPAEPTPPIAIHGGPANASVRTTATPVEVSDSILARLRDCGATVDTELESRTESSRDWWPAAMSWATDGQIPARAAAVVRPNQAEQVSSILAICNESRIPVTAAGGRSGVLGGSVPMYGGVLLDLCGLSGIRSVDDGSLVVDVLSGTFGDRFESELRTDHDLTCGHWPQSMTLSTVGGWIACRGAGQFSTRYGKIEDMVVGLDVILADGTEITTGGYPRSATGPDLNQLFVGSEGTLGVITAARLKVHPVPPATAKAAYSVPSFAAGLDLFRGVMRTGATPAVLRLYDEVESDRNFSTGDDLCVVTVLDEGDPVIVEATMAVVEREARSFAGGKSLEDNLIDHWLANRNEVSQLEALIQGGIVVDTMEVSGPWSALADAYSAVTDAMKAVPGCLAASAHCSHSYLDGACVYFTFGGKPSEPTRDAWDRLHAALWDAGQTAALNHGCSVSHHHGIGIHRGEYLRESLGTAHGVLTTIKDALDPHDILNPGKMGMESSFGPGWSGLP